MKKIHYIYAIALSMGTLNAGDLIKNQGNPTPAMKIFQAETIIETQYHSIRELTGIQDGILALSSKIENGIIAVDSAHFDGLIKQAHANLKSIHIRVREFFDPMSIAGDALISMLQTKNDELRDKAVSELAQTLLELFEPLITTPSDQTLIALEQALQAIDPIYDNTDFNKSIITKSAYENIIMAIISYIETLRFFNILISTQPKPSWQLGNYVPYAFMGAQFAFDYLKKPSLQQQVTNTLVNARLKLTPLSTKLQTPLLKKSTTPASQVLFPITDMKLAKEIIAPSKFKIIGEAALEFSKTIGIILLQDAIIQKIADYLNKKIEKVDTQINAYSIIKSEVQLCKMHAEVTKETAQFIYKQIPNLAPSESLDNLTGYMHRLINSLLILSSNIAGFADNDRAAGIALKSIIAQRIEEGKHTNTERLEIFSKIIIPLIATPPLPLGSKIDKLSVTHLNEYAEKLKNARAQFVFTPSERQRAEQLETKKQTGNALLQDDVLPQEIVSRLTILIDSYRASLLAMTNLLNQLKDYLPGSEGILFRAWRYITSGKIYQKTTTLSLNMVYTHTQKTIVNALFSTTTSGILYSSVSGVVGYFIISMVGALLIEKAQSATKSLIAPPKEPTELIKAIAAKERKEQEQKESSRAQNALAEQIERSYARHKAQAAQN